MGQKNTDSSMPAWAVAIVTTPVWSAVWVSSVIGPCEAGQGLSPHLVEKGEMVALLPKAKGGQMTPLQSSPPNKSATFSLKKKRG